MRKWKCSVCGYIYDESREGTPFEELPEGWTCPRCGAPKSAFRVIEGEATVSRAKATVADKLVDQLAAYGVRRVYGIPGHSNLPLTDALRRHPDIELILTRHEQAAAYMASAHAKLTGKIGVCMSIAGPGATNLITGIVDAFTDRAPVLALLGQVPEVFLGSESLQEIAETDIFKTFCVYAEMITNPGHALKVLNLAVKKAYAAPGPVALSLPTDVLAEPLDEPIWSPDAHLFSPDLFPGDSINRTAALLRKSRRPVLFAGWGARHCGPDLLELAYYIGAPIATTSRAKGVVSEADEMVLGVLGSIGNRFAPRIVQQADLIVILGSGFRQRNLVPDIDVVQVDIDASRVGKTFPVKAGIVGDAQRVIRMLREALPKREMDPEFRSLIEESHAKYRALLEADRQNLHKPIYPGTVIQALKKHAPENAIICGRRVIALTGDGGFGMAGMEFTTAVHNRLPITVVVFNDGKLKNIKKEMEEYGYPVYRLDFPNPDFAQFATTAGGLGIRVEEPENLDEAFRKALSSSLPSLIDVKIDPERYIEAIHRL
jgi:pyruvate oxidase